MISIPDTIPEKLSKALLMILMARATDTPEIRAQHLSAAEVILEMALGVMTDSQGPLAKAAYTQPTGKRARTPKRAWEPPIGFSHPMDPENA